ncbi:MAG: Mth938-like domain-containing protein [Pseudomonadota bacterium]|nr:Mth938-like domain-containing protein [Pseudomonadota bacterium]
MKLHLSRSSNTYLISGYGRDHFLINGVRHETSLIVLPDEVVTGWARHFDQLAPEHFDALAMRAPEIILLGSGVSLRFPAPALYAGLIKARIGVEVMDTPAACRTYNILAAEGRRVAAALILG